MSGRGKAYVCIFVLGLWLVAENGFLLWHRHKRDPRHFPNTLEIAYLNVVRPHTKSDPIVGYKPSPLGHARVITKKNGVVINTAEYIADLYGRRVTPGQEGARANATLFFGCSFTFGSGVNDDQTLPYYYSQIAKDSRSYNYAYFGYGPQQTFGRLKRTNLRNEVPETKALGIFTFIDDHVARAIGSMQTHNMKRAWGMDMPLYRLTSGGIPESKGSYFTARPFTAIFYQALGLSEILYHFNFNLPPSLRNEDFQLTEKLLSGSRAEFQRQFPGGEFIVLFYPGSHLSSRLKPLLEADGVPTLDYSGWKDDPDMWIPDYGHPSPMAYQRVAKQLHADLMARRLTLTRQ